MKKLIIIMLTVMSISTFAMKIGIVNTQKVISNYSKSKTTMKNLQKEQTKLEEQLQVKADSLELLADKLRAKGNKVTTAEKKSFSKQKNQFDEMRTQMGNKLKKMQYTAMSGIQKELQLAVAKISKTDKYDLILQSEAVLHGGKDITNQVLKTLESSKKINLN